MTMFPARQPLASRFSTVLHNRFPVKNTLDKQQYYKLAILALSYKRGKEMQLAKYMDFHNYIGLYVYIMLHRFLNCSVSRILMALL